MRQERQEQELAEQRTRNAREVIEERIRVGRLAKRRQREFAAQQIEEEKTKRLLNSGCKRQDA